MLYIIVHNILRWRNRRWSSYLCSGWFLENLGKCNDHQSLISLFTVTYLLFSCWFCFHVVVGCWVVAEPAFYNLVAAIVIVFLNTYCIRLNIDCYFLNIYLGRLFRSRLFYLFTIVHNCSRLFTIVHNCSWLFTTVWIHSRLFTLF